MFRNTHLQSDHRLVVANIRLKLKPILQRELRRQIDMTRLREEEVEKLKTVLKELGADLTDGVDEA